MKLLIGPAIVVVVAGLWLLLAGLCSHPAQSHPPEPIQPAIRGDLQR